MSPSGLRAVTQAVDSAAGHGLELGEVAGVDRFADQLFDGGQARVDGGRRVSASRLGLATKGVEVAKSSEPTWLRRVPRGQHGTSVQPEGFRRRMGTGLAGT
jgi:hypothetical protein